MSEILNMTFNLNQILKYNLTICVTPLRAQLSARAVGFTTSRRRYFFNFVAVDTLLFPTATIWAKNSFLRPRRL